LIGVAASFTSTNTNYWGWIVLLIGVAMLVSYFRDKPRRWVLVGTAGAETKAVESKDPYRTGRIVEAMNAAIISRG
jgi:hypothetical protein